MTTDADLRRKTQNDLITAKTPPGKSSKRQPVTARPGL